MRVLVCLLCACVSGRAPLPPADTDAPPVGTGVLDTVAPETDLPDDPCLRRTPTVAITTASGALTAGADLWMVHGRDGLWQFPLTVTVSDVPQDVVIEARLTRTGADDPTAEATAGVTLVPDDGGASWDCRGTTPVAPTVVFPEGTTDRRPWETHCGVAATLSVTVSLPGAPAGPGPRLATRTDDVVLQPDPCDCDACDPATPRTCPWTDPGDPRFDPGYVRACDGPG